VIQCPPCGQMRDIAGRSVTQACLNTLNLKIVVSWDMTPCSLAYTVVIKISDILSALNCNVDMLAARGSWKEYCTGKRFGRVPFAERVRWRQ
jgi:hypothetical protein